MIPLAKNIKRYFSLKELAIVFLAVVISIAAGVGFFQSMKKEIVINDNGKKIDVITMKTTVKEVLEQNSVIVRPEDYLNYSPDTMLHKIGRNEIYIKRAVPISVTADGQEIKVMTYKDTVKEALENSPAKLSDNDKLEGAALEDPIVKDMQVRVVRVNEEIMAEKTPIPFNVVSRENSHLDQGVERTLREGTEGVREKSFKVVYEDGKQVAKNLIKDVVLASPIEKIVEIGTVLNYKTARGDTVRYKKVLGMRATAYTASYADTGKNPGDPMFGITSTGAKAKKGLIAVDPRVIPMGTRVYVEIAGSTPDYGFAVAADTGGAIKGDLIDLYYDDEGTVNSFGCKRCKVYFLTD